MILQKILKMMLFKPAFFYLGNLCKKLLITADFREYKSNESRYFVIKITYFHFYNSIKLKKVQESDSSRFSKPYSHNSITNFVIDILFF